MSTAAIWGEVRGFAGERVKTSLIKPIAANRPNDPSADDKPPSHTIFFVNVAILGAHVTNPGSVELTSVHFSLSDLEWFVGASPISVEHRDDRSRNISFRPTETLKETIGDASLEFTLATNGEYEWSRSDRTCGFKWCDEVIVTPRAAMPLDECMKYVESIMNFFRMCVRAAVELRYVRGVSPTGEVISYLFNDSSTQARTMPADWILTLKHLGGTLKTVLDQWFSLVAKLGFAGPVFFSEVTHPSPVQDARLLHFAGCLEAFHRNIVEPESPKFLPTAEYNEVTNNFLNNLPVVWPPVLKERMKGALSRANSHEFAERIEALFYGLKGTTQQALTDDPARFLKAIKDTRNKLAHVSDKDSGFNFEGKALGHANRSIQGWLTILILKECGVDESLILDRMREVQYFYWGPFKFLKEVV